MIREGRHGDNLDRWLIWDQLALIPYRGTNISIVSMKNFPHILLIETLCYIESDWEASLGNIYTISLNLCDCYNIQLYNSNLETTPNIELNDRIFGMILG